MKTVKIFGIFALLISFTSCGGNKNDAEILEKEQEAPVEMEIPEGWKSSATEEYGFHHPDSFEVDMSGSSGLNLLLLSPQTSTSDLFRENINLLTQDMPAGNFTLDQYAKGSIAQIEQLITGAKVEESKRIKVNGVDYHKVIYAGQQGTMNLKWQQWFRLQGKKAYILTLTCESSQYDNYVDVSTKIMETFEIK